MSKDDYATLFFIVFGLIAVVHFVYSFMVEFEMRRRQHKYVVILSAFIIGTLMSLIYLPATILIIPLVTLITIQNLRHIKVCVNCRKFIQPYNLRSMIVHGAKNKCLKCGSELEKVIPE